MLMMTAIGIATIVRTAFAYLEYRKLRFACCLLAMFKSCNLQSVFHWPFTIRHSPIANHDIGADVCALRIITLANGK